MNIKPHSRRFYLLTLLLLILVVPLYLSGCGSGGGGSSSYNGASVSPSSSGGLNLSQAYTISGTATGGSSPLSGVTVTLYVLNTANDSFSSTGDAATTNSSGSYTLPPYNGSGTEYFLVVAVTPSGNTMYNIAFGSFGIPDVTMNIDELTTAQTVYAFNQAGGTMTASNKGIPQARYPIILNFIIIYQQVQAIPIQ